MGVLDRQMGLAYPAQPVERLHHQRRLSSAQPPPQLDEHAVAAPVNQGFRGGTRHT